MWSVGSAGETLYVSDLDFTLLHSDSTLGAQTIDVVDRLVARGHRFTYATARSYTSAAPVTEGLRLTAPVITYSGAVLVDPDDGAMTEVRPIPDAAVAAIMATTDAGCPVEPLFFTILDGRDRVCWRRSRTNAFIDAFTARRQGDPRLFPVTDWSSIDATPAFYTTLIGEAETVHELLDTLGPDLDECFVTVGPDRYDPDQTWLEITSKAATKAAAARRVGSRLGCRRIVAFGDNHVDAPLLEMADHSCAVANAVPEILATAEEVIGSNDDDGVARWLDEHVLCPARR